MACDDIVRSPIVGPWVSTGRSFDQRLRLRVPPLFRSLTSVIVRLPARSRVRRLLVDQAIRSAYRAYNRRDFAVVLAFYHPRVEIRLHHISGMEGTYHGHEGWRRYWARWFDVWDESYMEPAEVVESRNRVLVLGRIRCRSVHAGLEMEQPLAQLTTVLEGLVARHEEWFDHAAGLDALCTREEVALHRG